MTTIEKEQFMESTITFPEYTAQIHNLTELRQMAVLGVVLIDYLKGNLSFMQAAEELGLDREGMTDLLYNLQIPLHRSLPPDLEESAKNAREELIESLAV